MTTPDHEAMRAASAVAPVRVFIVADGPARDAEIARQAGERGLRESDIVILLVGVEPSSIPAGAEDTLATSKSETAAENAR